MQTANSSWVASLVVIGMIVGISSVASADRVALLPPSGVNLHEAYLYASQDFARGYLEENGYEVVVIDGAPRAREPDSAEAVRAAREAGAQLAVVIHITRLGRTAKVKLTAYDTYRGGVFYRDQLTAGSPDDVDPVLARLVTGLATGQPASDMADIHTVTGEEQDPLRKRTATSVFGVRIGVVSPMARPDAGDEDSLFGMGVFWLYDVRTFLAEVGLDFHTADDEGDFTVDLGAYYPLSGNNTSPYLGGGLRYGTADYGGDGASGVSAFGGIGLLIGRLSTVQIRGEVDYFVNLFDEEDDKGESTYASGFLFNVGIGF